MQEEMTLELKQNKTKQPLAISHLVADWLL